MRKLILFLDLYCSLTKYDGEGLLLRDLALYERLLSQGAFEAIDILTYDHRDHAKLAELQGKGLISQKIGILTPPPALRYGLGAVLFSLVGPLIHHRAMSQASMFKTHQVSGGWTGLLAKWLFRKPLLFRLGYPLSVRFEVEGKALKRRLTRLLEAVLVRCSDHVAVTSHAMLSYYGAMSKGRAITLVPNYVDVSGFTQISDYDASRPILYVGRLEDVKNVGSLIAACGRLGVALDIYGGGSQEEELKHMALTCGTKATFHGFVSNADLMRVHHQHTICVLCSTREGMPKSLIEVMASGLICISTRTDGPLELIRDGETGHLIDGFDADAIQSKLAYVLAHLDPDVGRRGAAFVRRNNSLEHSLNLELEIIDRICASKADRADVRPALR